MTFKSVFILQKSESNLRNHLRVTANSTQESNTNDSNKDNNGVSTSLLVVPNQTSGSSSASNRAGAPNNKATSLRKREVTLSKVSIYIVFVFLFCHSVRIIPNTYEMVFTYIQVSLESLSRSLNKWLSESLELVCYSQKTRL